MSKESLFWGNATGKLGQAVLYRSNGEQRARMYVRNIKNPRTIKQVAARMSLSNLVNTFKAFKPVVQAGWPKRPANQSAYNAFVAANKNNDTAVITKGMQNDGLCMPAGMIITDGELPLSIGVQPDLAGRGKDKYIGFYITGLKMAGKEISGEEGDDRAAIANTEDLYNCIVGTTNPNSLPSRFRLTVLLGTLQHTDGVGIELDTLAFRCGYASIMVCSSDDKVYESDKEWTYHNWPIHDKAPLYMVKDSSTKNLVGLSVTYPKKDIEEKGDYVAAVVISYTDPQGKVVCSRSTITAWWGKNEQYAEEYYPGGEVYQTALSQIGYTESDPLGTR